MERLSFGGTGLGVILALLNAPQVSQLPGVKPLPGTTDFSCPTGG